jgi:hypothetical protein
MKIIDIIIIKCKQNQYLAIIQIKQASKQIQIQIQE